jgi:hypothetical protein
MTIQEAIELLKANDYRVSKPRARKPVPTGNGLNVLGKPYSSNYDPNYRMRYRPSIANIFKSSGGWRDNSRFFMSSNAAAWHERCKLAELGAIQAGMMTLDQCRFYGK